MKSLKRLLLAFVVASLLVAAAYAGWGKDLNIIDPLSTGNLDVKFTSGHVASSPHITASLTVGNHEAQVNASNLYPGGWVYFDLRAINAGTIPAKLASAELLLNPAGDTIWEYIKATCWVTYDVDGDAGPEPAGAITIQSGRPFNELAANLTSKLHGLTFQPGGWITFDAPEGTDLNEDGVVNGEDQNCIAMWLDRNAPNETEGKNVNFTLKLNWKQFNK